MGGGRGERDTTNKQKILFVVHHFQYSATILPGEEERGEVNQLKISSNHQNIEIVILKKKNQPNNHLHYSKEGMVVIARIGFLISFFFVIFISYFQGYIKG